MRVFSLMMFVGIGNTHIQRMRFCRTVLWALLLAVLGWSRAWAATQPAAESIINNLTFPSSFQAASLSPDGRRLAAIGSYGLGSILFLVDVETLDFKPLIAPRRVETLNYRYVRSAAAVRWIENDLLAVDFNDDEAEAMDLAGKKVASLGAHYIGRVAGKSDPVEFFVLAFLDAERQSLALVNPRTGARKRYGSPPSGKLLDVAFDDEGTLRAATTVDTTFWTERTTVSQWYRPGEQAAWQLLEQGPVTADHWRPLYVPAGPASLVVQSRHDRDTWAIFRYDTNKHAEVELMAGHPSEDIIHASGLGNEVFHRVVTNGLEQQTHWFDPRWARLQAAVDKALPKRVNVLSGDPLTSVLVFSHADVDPGRWYVFNTIAMTLKEVLQAAPRIRIDAMRPMQTLRYAARDGVVVPGYLTLPDATGARPMVVLIHGGPATRDQWAWDAQVQLLALNGYVVFQPQFRGSTGFGAAFERAGHGQWGLGMQDDVTDGVRYLIEQKIADPSRICIYGSSYGGYAALWGLAKTPDLYRCGISFAGVTDIDALLGGRSDINSDPAAREWIRFQLGTTVTDKPRFEAVSPLRQANLIQAPVLLAHGKYDRRVPVSHGRNMAEALKANGKTYQWMLFENEAHGLAYLDNQRKYFHALLDFLDRYIGPDAAVSGGQPAAAQPASPKAQVPAD
jgi:dipeptidyl aminopeptidase/acylaminoacyl peptidase